MSAAGSDRRTATARPAPRDEPMRSCSSTTISSGAATTTTSFSEPRGEVAAGAQVELPEGFAERDGRRRLARVGRPSSGPGSGEQLRRLGPGNARLNRGRADERHVHRGSAVSAHGTTTEGATNAMKARIAMIAGACALVAGLLGPSSALAHQQPPQPR